MVNQMKMVTVTGYKGGVGKSTTAIHLAAFFADHGQTLLVDGDPNRTAMAWSQRGSFRFTVADERQAMRMVSGMSYVIIDTPARPNTQDLDELSKGCDLLVLPTTPDVVSLQPMLETTKVIGSANYRALIALVPPYPSREGEQIRKDLQAAGVPVFQTLIRRSVSYQKAAMAGCPVRNLADIRARKWWEDYQALGREVLEVFER